MAGMKQTDALLKHRHSNVELMVPALPESEQTNTSTDEAPIKQQTHRNCLKVSFNVCGYTTSVWYTMLVFVAITLGLFTEYFIVAIANWYDHVGESAWVISTYMTFGWMLYNLRCKEDDIFSSHDYNKTEFCVCCVIFMLVAIVIRFVHFSAFICKSAVKMEALLAATASFIVNILTMYALALVMLYKSLKVVDKYNKLIAKIESNDIHFDEIKADYDKIQNMLKSVKQNWEFIVSVSLFYHIFFPTISFSVWLTNYSNDLWMYCDNRSWTQLSIVIIRGVVRMFGLVYGIIRVNTQPFKLAEAISIHCNWDNKQQVKIQRLKSTLIDFPPGFKVMWIKITWKHFVGAAISAITASLVSLVRTRLEQ